MSCEPYLDTRPRSAFDRERPWLVTVKGEHVTQTHRFRTEQEAREFAEGIEAEAANT